MASKQKQKPHRPRRERTKPVQIYFSESEHGGLMYLAVKNKRTVSEQVRAMVAASFARSKPKHGQKREPIDPRQVDMF